MKFLLRFSTLEVNVFIEGVELAKQKEEKKVK